MFAKSPVLSKCTSCRDGRKAVDGLRGGIRFGQSVVSQLEVRAATELTLCGVQFMSQCKGPSIAFLSGYNHFFPTFLKTLIPKILNKFSHFLISPPDLELRLKGSLEGTTVPRP